MKNIKKFLIVFFSILFCVNSVNAKTIYNDHIKIDKHILTNKKNKSFYGVKIYNINNNNNDYDENLMNIVFYGKKYLNHNIITYFTLGANFNNKNLKLMYKNFSVQIVNAKMLGIYIKNLGIIEYSRNYNLIHDINRFTRKNFYNNYYLPQQFKDNNILYQMKNSIAYRNTKMFGLIDHLTIALQYQYLDNILRNIQRNFLNHMIQYDFTKMGLSIATAYSSDIHHIVDPLNNNPNFKHQAYAFAIKYNLYKLYLSYFYSRSINIDSNFSKLILLNNSKNFEFFLEYKISPKFSFNIGYLRMYKILYTYHTYQNFFQNKKYLHHNLSILHEMNISLKYLYSKNIFLYYNNKIYFLKNKACLKLNDIKSIFQIGIVYFF